MTPTLLLRIPEGYALTSNEKEAILDNFPPYREIKTETYIQGSNNYLVDNTTRAQEFLRAFEFITTCKSSSLDKAQIQQAKDHAEFCNTQIYFPTTLTVEQSRERLESVTKLLVAGLMSIYGLEQQEATEWLNKADQTVLFSESRPDIATLSIYTTHKDNQRIDTKIIQYDAQLPKDEQRMLNDFTAIKNNPWKPAFNWFYESSPGLIQFLYYSQNNEKAALLAEINQYIINNEADKENHPVLQHLFYGSTGHHLSSTADKITKFSTIRDQVNKLSIEDLLTLETIRLLPLWYIVVLTPYKKEFLYHVLKNTSDLKAFIKEKATVTSRFRELPFCANHYRHQLFVQVFLAQESCSPWQEIGSSDREGHVGSRETAFLENSHPEICDFYTSTSIDHTIQQLQKDPFEPCGFLYHATTDPVDETLLTRSTYIMTPHKIFYYYAPTKTLTELPCSSDEFSSLILFKETLLSNNTPSKNKLTYEEQLTLLELTHYYIPSRKKENDPSFILLKSLISPLAKTMIPLVATAIQAVTRLPDDFLDRQRRSLMGQAFHDVMSTNTPLNSAAYITAKDDPNRRKILSTLENSIETWREVQQKTPTTDLDNTLKYLDSLKITYENLINRLPLAQISSTGLDQEAINLQISTTENLIFHFLKGLIVCMCASGKDRTALDAIRFTAELLFEKIYGRLKQATSILDIAAVNDITAHLLLTGHMQEHASGNARGSRGLKNGLKYLAYNTSQTIGAQYLKTSNITAGTNEPRDILKAKITTENLLEIMHATNLFINIKNTLMVSNNEDNYKKFETEIANKRWKSKGNSLLGSKTPKGILSMQSILQNNILSTEEKWSLIIMEAISGFYRGLQSNYFQTSNTHEFYQDIIKTFAPSILFIDLSREDLQQIIQLIALIVRDSAWEHAGKTTWGGKKCPGGITKMRTITITKAPSYDMLLQCFFLAVDASNGSRGPKTQEFYSLIEKLKSLGGWVDAKAAISGLTAFAKTLKSQNNTRLDNHLELETTPPERPHSN